MVDPPTHAIDGLICCGPMVTGKEAPVGEGEQDATAELRGRLAKLTPRIVVTPTLIALNALVFVAMAATGVGLLKPEVEGLLRWGANYGPLTTAGQPWRLASSMFVHVGVVHLLFNMWVLMDAGPIVERLVGPLVFGVAYLLAGLGGSLISLAVHPEIVSAGASGAIFGIYGVLAAFLLRQRSAVPAEGLKPLARSALFFVGYNVVYGIGKQGVDLAAHLGGIASGFVVGLPLVHALAPDARARAQRRTVAVAIVGLAAVIATVTLAIPRTVVFGRQLADVGATMTRLTSRYNNEVVQALQDAKNTGPQTARLLDDELVPGARAAQAELSKLQPRTRRDREALALVQRSAELLEQMFTAVAEAARTNRYQGLPERIATFDKEQGEINKKVEALGSRPAD
jgi:rhomboid protease GluP